MSCNLDLLAAWAAARTTLTKSSGPRGPFDFDLRSLHIVVKDHLAFEIVIESRYGLCTFSSRYIRNKKYKKGKRLKRLLLIAWVVEFVYTQEKEI